MSQTVTIAGDDIRLSLLLWRRHGRAGLALLSQTLDLNPGLAAIGPILPIGTVVTLPDLPTPRQAPARAPVSLFGN